MIRLMSAAVAVCFVVLSTSAGLSPALADEPAPARGGHLLGPDAGKARQPVRTAQTPATTRTAEADSCGGSFAKCSAGQAGR